MLVLREHWGAIGEGSGWQRCGGGCCSLACGTTGPLMPVSVLLPQWPSLCQPLPTTAAARGDLATLAKTWTWHERRSQSTPHRLPATPRPDWSRHCRNSKLPHSSLGRGYKISPHHSLPITRSHDLTGPPPPLLPSPPLPTRPSPPRWMPLARSTAPAASARPRSAVPVSSWPTTSTASTAASVASPTSATRMARPPCPSRTKPVLCRILCNTYIGLND